MNMFLVVDGIELPMLLIGELKVVLRRPCQKTIAPKNAEIVMTTREEVLKFHVHLPNGITRGVTDVRVKWY